MEKDAKISGIKTFDMFDQSKYFCMSLKLKYAQM
jgi:hypothetical protein